MLMNAPAILNEILQALKDLYEKGKEHIIYINKIPITEEDRIAILDTLGEGQVRISLILRPSQQNGEKRVYMAFGLVCSLIEITSLYWKPLK